MTMSLQESSDRLEIQDNWEALDDVSFDGGVAHGGAATSTTARRSSRADPAGG
jgi:hypothetical protein